MRKLFFLSFLMAVFASANAQISVDTQEHEYGALENIYRLQSDFVLTNTGTKNLYLMRADAAPEVKVWSAKKSIAPGDTTIVQVWYIPKSTGHFNYSVKLITSASADPMVLKIKGDIKSLKTDDKTACFYFGKPRPKHYTKDPGPLIVSAPGRYQNADSIFRSRPQFEAPKKDPLVTSSPVIETPTIEPFKKSEGELPSTEFKPNNVIFLIDVSGSMIDSVKLRWLKLSMKKLIANVRPEDKITLVTYRDTVMCIAEAVDAEQKNLLVEKVSELKAKGLTRGNRAIHFALDIALKHYIQDGNNQIILATDGEFTFREQDYKKWTEKTVGKTIVLSTLAFGDSDKAMKNLKEIARKGNGSFIRVKTRRAAETAVFDEIALRSRR